MRFSGSFLVLFLALILQFYLGDATGFWINFALAALITAAFFLNLLGVIVLVLFAVLLLNSRPGLSWEILVFSVVPLLVFAAKKFLPLQPWLNNLIMILCGSILFYLLIDFHFLFRRLGVFAVDLSASLIFGLLAFGVLRMVSPRRDGP